MRTSIWAILDFTMKGLPSARKLLSEMVGGRFKASPLDFEVH